MPGRGRNQRNKLKQKSKSTSQLGVCICPQCNYSVTHKRGIPCVSVLCPKCNIPLTRQGLSQNKNQQSNLDKSIKSSSFPKIETALCVGCGACVKACPTDAIILENGKARINTEKCKNCGACINACPINIIT